MTTSSPSTSSRPTDQDVPATPGLSRRMLEQWIEGNVGADFLDKLRSVPTPRNEFGVDPFGFDPEVLAWSIPVAHFLYRRYFRVEAHRVQNVPEGPVLLVANHSGQIPIDAMMLATSLLLDHPRPRVARSMIERWVPTLPFVSYYLARCGQVVGTRENCRALLSQGECILVFPEGAKGISKTFDKRYQLQEFGLGFMRLALESGAAVIGAEEQAPSLYNAKPLARLLGAPAFPITPTFPWLPVLGMLPYPTKYRIWFGDPIHFAGDPDDDDHVIAAKEVKRTLSGLVSHGLEERQAIFW